MFIPVSEQLVLRTYMAADAPALFECVRQNRAHLRTFLPWVDTTTRPEHSMNFIQYTNMQEATQQGLAMAIFKEEQLIGGIGMHDWHHELKKAQLGYWLIAQEEGKGQMQQCARAFIQFLFDKLGLNKIEICFLPYNTRSGALAKALGATVEGMLRHHILINGSYEDLVLTGILKREWSSNITARQTDDTIIHSGHSA